VSALYGGEQLYCAAETFVLARVGRQRPTPPRSCSSAQILRPSLPAKAHNRAMPLYKRRGLERIAKRSSKKKRREMPGNVRDNELARPLPRLLGNLR
jgi:hypothetical protein